MQKKLTDSTETTKPSNLEDARKKAVIMLEALIRRLKDESEVFGSQNVVS